MPYHNFIEANDVVWEYEEVIVVDYGLPVRKKWDNGVIIQKLGGKGGFIKVGIHQIYVKYKYLNTACNLDQTYILFLWHFLLSVTILYENIRVS